MPFTNISSNVTFSIDNTTFQPLLANEIFVGKWEDVSQSAILYTLWRTNVGGLLNYQFSTDGIDIDRSFPVPTLDLSDGNYTSSGPRGRYFRIQYINGVEDQEYFRLQTTYSTSVIDGGRTSIASGVSAKTVSEATRAVNFGITDDGAYAPIKVSDGGAIVTCSTPLSPNCQTNELITSSSDADQVIVSYTPSKSFVLSGWSSYVWSEMTSYSMVFGKVSLESPAGTKLYTSQLTSMGLGKDIVILGQSITLPANQTIRLVCSPSSPVNSQTWQGNLIGLSQ
jgi:hypothetical protein